MHWPPIPPAEPEIHRERPVYRFHCPCGRVLETVNEEARCHRCGRAHTLNSDIRRELRWELIPNRRPALAGR
jgi:hypothetical protein